MNRKSAFAQFAKDCPNHFSKKILSNTTLFNPIPYKHVSEEKSTYNAKSPNKF